MNLIREGLPVDESTYIKSTQAMQKMQEITDRLAVNTPDLNKYVSGDSLLKPQKTFGQEQTLIQPNKKNELLEMNRKKKNQINFSQSQTTKNEMTVVDWQKKCADIAAVWNKEKEKNQILIQDLNNRQERFVKRELEYRKIIEELQNELRSKSSLDINDKRLMEPIFSLHSKIIDNINQIQLKTSKVMIDQERDIMRFFINKINEIKKEYEEERIRKGKKDQDYLEKENKLISELEWIKNIAQKIDNENHSLMKKYMDLKAQYQTQENDREMILKELIMKKKKNAILKSQIEQYEKLLNEVAKEEEDKSEHMEEKDEFRSTSRSNFVSKIKKDVSSHRGNIDNKSKTMTENFGTFKENSQNNDPIQDRLLRSENTINTLKKTLQKEQKRVREIKELYIKEVQSKTELEKILRKCIEDIKEEMVKIKTVSRIKGDKSNDFLREERETLISQLLNNEKVLSMIYDKTFYDKNEVKNDDDLVDI